MLAIGVDDRDRRPGLAPVLQLRHRSSRNSPRSTSASSPATGRHDFWRVAIDAFGEEPLLGHGAGTYVFSWDQHCARSTMPVARRPLALPRGLRRARRRRRPAGPRPGPRPLWFGFSAWRRGARPAARGAMRRCFAAMVAFAVGAAFDWFWEIAGLGAVFFLAAGVVGRRPLRAARIGCGRRSRRRRAQLRPGDRSASALAWLAAIALIGPLLVEHEIEHASEARRRRRPQQRATNHAETARSIEPWAASPYLQLGLVAERAAANTRGRRNARARRSNAKTATGSSTPCARGSSARRATRPPRAATSNTRGASTRSHPQLQGKLAR